MALFNQLRACSSQPELSVALRSIWQCLEAFLLVATGVSRVPEELTRSPVRGC